MSDAYLCSFHIPKTGGTTFAHHIRTSLAPDEFFLHGPAARAERFMQDRPQLEEASPQERSRIRAVHGHGAGIEVAVTMPGRFPEYMVILREPYARFVSGFNHFNGERRNNALPPVTAERYLDSHGSDVYSTLLFRHFKPLAGRGKGMTFERLLPILKSFKYFVVTEHIDDQVPALCEQLKLPPQKVETRRVNANKVDALIDMERFRRLNELDNLVYKQIAARGASLANPFGYEPDILRNYLRTAWEATSPEQRLLGAYEDLVLSLKKSLKLHAAHEKLASRPNPHVQDIPALTALVAESVQPWVASINPAALSMAYFWTGIMYMDSAQQPRAEKFFRESIALNPENDNSLARLAQVLAGRQEIAEASRLIEKAVALRPDRQINQKIRETILKRARG